MLIPFLILLGTFIPPIGAIIMTDYWVKYKSAPPTLEQAIIPSFNMQGLVAYAIGSAAAYFSPWIAPLVGIAVSSVAYSIFVFAYSTETRVAKEA